MLRRHAAFEAVVGDVLLAGGRHVLRDQDVDAVGLAANVRVDPFQLLLDHFGRLAGGAIDAKAAGAADRGDDVPAMAEGDQRELDAQHVADR